MYVTALLPFAALIVAVGLQATWSWATRSRVPAEHLRWPSAHQRIPGAVRHAVAAVSAVAFASMAAVTVFFVAPQWASADRAAMTIRLDGAQRAAEHWLVQHVGHEQRLIVSDMYWIYLIQHGFDSHPVKGGLNSRTVQSYWELDYDPAVQHRFPYGWREFTYIVSDEAMRVTATYTPNTADALQHSYRVAVFGSGNQRIEVREIMPTPMRSHFTKAGNLEYRVAGPGLARGLGRQWIPLANVTLSLDQVARFLHVRVNDITARTNSYPDDPAWWYYEGLHNYDAPLPQGIILHYLAG